MPDCLRLTERPRQGKNITEYMNLGAEVNVGDEMADGDLYDSEGNLHHLSEFKGQYILLDFWSMGCGPCVQSIPEMEEVTAIYKDKLAVVSISGDSKENWKKFISEKSMTGNQWNELKNGRTGLAARYKVVGIPPLCIDLTGRDSTGDVEWIWPRFIKREAERVSKIDHIPY